MTLTKRESNGLYTPRNNVVIHLVEAVKGVSTVNLATVNVLLKYQHVLVK